MLFRSEALFSCLKEENLEKRTLSFTQLRWLVSDIRTVLFRKRLSVDPSLTDAPERKELLDLIDRQFENEISLDSLQSIALQLCSFYGSFTGRKYGSWQSKALTLTHYHPKTPGPQVFSTAVRGTF